MHLGGGKSGWIPIAAKLNRGNWRYTSAYDAVRIIFGEYGRVDVGGVIIFFLPVPWGIPCSVYILDWMVRCFLTLGGRLAVRVVITTRMARRAEGDFDEDAYLWRRHSGPGVVMGASPKPFS